MLPLTALNSVLSLQVNRDRKLTLDVKKLRAESGHVTEVNNWLSTSLFGPAPLSSVNTHTALTVNLLSHNGMFHITFDFMIRMGKY